MYIPPQVTISARQCICKFACRYIYILMRMYTYIYTYMDVFIHILNHPHKSIKTLQRVFPHSWFISFQTYEAREKQKANLAFVWCNRKFAVLMWFSQSIKPQLRVPLLAARPKCFPTYVLVSHFTLNLLPFYELSPKGGFLICIFGIFCA